RKYTLADAIINRLTRRIDRAALKAIVEGVELNFDTEAQASASAERLAQAMHDPLAPNAISVEVLFDDATEKHRLAVYRTQHGNVRTSIIDSDFLVGADYETLVTAAVTFQGLLGPGAQIQRGEGDKQRSAVVSNFGDAVQWLRSEAERGV